jgi:hypothetical protein
MRQLDWLPVISSLLLLEVGCRGGSDLQAFCSGIRVGETVEAARERGRSSEFALTQTSNGVLADQKIGMFTHAFCQVRSSDGIVTSAEYFVD